jgi:hypothetical protein
LDRGVGEARVICNEVGLNRHNRFVCQSERSPESDRAA